MNTNTISLNCNNCKQFFEKPLNVYNYAIRHRQQTKFFCSPKCIGESKKQPNLSGICKNCNQPFTRAYKSKSTDTLSFCSQQCANIELAKNRKKSKQCQVDNCLNIVLHKNNKYCIECFSKKLYKTKTISRKRFNNLDQITLKDLRLNYSTAKYHAKVRADARAAYKESNRLLICEICKYSKHVIICHIQGLSSFSLDSTIAEVNNQKNLIALCLNHHYEFDRNLLSKNDLNLIKLKIKELLN